MKDHCTLKLLLSAVSRDNSSLLEITFRLIINLVVLIAAANYKFRLNLNYY